MFNGKYWQPLDLDTLKLFLANAAKKLGVPPLEANYHRLRDELYKQFAAVLNIDTPEPPQGVTLINLQNGTFEISDENCRKVLAEYIGYIFTSGLKLEKVAILYGGGSNGKSVFF